MNYDDRELLARLIQCEAGGEGEDGMRAVATVVMNRVRAPSGEYLRTGNGELRNIVFQPGQFDCATTSLRGVHNPQNIYNMSPDQIHYDIADWALAGGIMPGVDESLWFYNPYSSNCREIFPVNGSGVIHNRINQHCFYRPTEKYQET